MRSFAMKAAVVASQRCGSPAARRGPDVRADYDKAVDFGKYRTYNFVAATGTGSTDAKSLAQQILQNAASREMESRGYTQGRQRRPADQLQGQARGKDRHRVDARRRCTARAGVIAAITAHRTARTVTAAPRSRPAVTTSARWSWTSSIAQKQQVVFQGGVEDVVTKKMLEDREALLTGAVSTIFAKFPFRAGQSAPVPTPAAQ